MNEANNDPKVPQILEGRKIVVDGVTYERFPIKTRLIGFKENFEAVIKENVAPFYKEGDWLVVSEKVVSVCYNEVRHISTVKVSPLARLLILGVKKHDNMTAWTQLEKLQVAIERAGVWRIIPAMIIGGIGKLFGLRGLFWIIAGNRVSEIDGFTKGAMYPYNEYAILPAPDPEKRCAEIEEHLGIPMVMADANFIDVQILGVSKKVNLSKKIVRKIILDNPLGQENKMTPFVLVRKVG